MYSAVFNKTINTIIETIISTCSVEEAFSCVCVEPVSAFVLFPHSRGIFKSYTILSSKQATVVYTVPEGMFSHAWLNFIVHVLAAISYLCAPYAFGVNAQAALHSFDTNNPSFPPEKHVVDLCCCWHMASCVLVDTSQPFDQEDSLFS